MNILSIVNGFFGPGVATLRADVDEIEAVLGWLGAADGLSVLADLLVRALDAVSSQESWVFDDVLRNFAESGELGARIKSSLTIV